jgi:uncharacterized phage protein (TIGR01671 family)
MQQYLFRGKRIDNGEWVTGNGIVIVDADYAAIPQTKDVTSKDYAIKLCKVIPETVGMWTGLKDKNGKDVYQGDIITHTRKSRPHSKSAKTTLVTCLVEWDSGYSKGPGKSNPSSFNREPGFAAYPVDRKAEGADWGYDWSEFHNCEIIGNCFDNPELVKTAVKDSVTNTMKDPNLAAANQTTEQATEQQNAQESASQDQAMEANAEEGGVEG